MHGDRTGTLTGSLAESPTDGRVDKARCACSCPGQLISTALSHRERLPLSSLRCELGGGGKILSVLVRHCEIPGM